MSWKKMRRGRAVHDFRERDGIIGKRESPPRKSQHTTGFVFPNSRPFPSVILSSFRPRPAPSDRSLHEHRARVIRGRQVRSVGRSVGLLAMGKSVAAAVGDGGARARGHGRTRTQSTPARSFVRPFFKASACAAAAPSVRRTRKGVTTGIRTIDAVLLKEYKSNRFR